jgi:hypothetical protein
MWRKDGDPSDEILKELAALRAEVERLRYRITAATRLDRRSAERRSRERPFSIDRRRHHS